VTGVIRVVIRVADGTRPGAEKDSAMNQPAKEQEPSMEEILASIRRIIAEDDAAKPAAVAPPPPVKPALRPAVPEHTAMSQDDIDAMLSSIDQPAPVPPPSPSPLPEPEPDVPAVDAAFNALGQTVLVQNARTLEDLVKEMLRPMLKSWLDDNLLNLVERMVRAEIERVSRGHR
jgi:cell pole-organizing protein PopZ